MKSQIAITKNLPELRHCNFCNKDNTQVEYLMIKDKIGICDKCIFLCVYAMLDQDYKHDQPEIDRKAIFKEIWG